MSTAVAESASSSAPPSPPRTSIPYWSAPVDELLDRLGSSRRGLTSGEAAARLAAVGPSAIPAVKSSSTARLLARQFASPLVILLGLAALLSTMIGEASDSAIIIVVVVASALLGFWQERRAADAVQQLLALVRTKASVLRDGTSTTVPLDDVVPGDIVVLDAGAMIPADCRLIEAQDLFVDEAALTGEAFPVAKHTAVSPAEAALAERDGSVFFGTHVVTGSAHAVAVRRGRDTEFGRIADRLRRPAPETEFERGIRRFGYLLLQITLTLALFVFAVNVARDRPVLESLLFTLALAVGLAPELLPAIVSITLAQGARAMARSRVIVKRLSAIEDLGAMNILCVDKTGTITEGVVALQSALDVDGHESDKVHRYAYINAALESGFANPIDETIRRTREFDLSAIRKAGELPYDFLRKRLSVAIAENGRRVLITKGALPNVLAACSVVEHADGTTARLGPLLDTITDRFERLSAQGLRCLGVAYRVLPADTPVDHDAERDLTFLGMIVLADPPKPGIAGTLGELSALGVGLKLVTGDNGLVAAAVARTIGLRADTILTGKDLNELSEAALQLRARETDVFAQVEPNQKDRIIRALRAGGAVVGFLGDGINDATALHSADVGISVDSASDVSKQAADIVLLDKDLGVLAAGLREGRRAFANTLKYVFITTSANFGNMVSMAAASLFTAFLPLLPKQILLVNFLTDVPSMAVATDRLDPELVSRPRRWDNRTIRDFTITFGLVSSVFDLLTFGLLLLLLRSDVEQFRTGWFLESVLSEILVLLVIRTQRPFFRSPVGRSLLVASLAIAIGTLALPYLALGESFGLAPVSAPVLLALFAITAAYVATSEFVKRVFFSRSR